MSRYTTIKEPVLKREYIYIYIYKYWFLTWNWKGQSYAPMPCGHIQTILQVAEMVSKDEAEAHYWKCFAIVCVQCSTPCLWAEANTSRMWQVLGRTLSWMMLNVRWSLQPQYQRYCLGFLVFLRYHLIFFLVSLLIFANLCSCLEASIVSLQLLCGEQRAWSPGTRPRVKTVAVREVSWYLRVIGCNWQWGGRNMQKSSPECPAKSWPWTWIVLCLGSTPSPPQWGQKWFYDALLLSLLP